VGESTKCFPTREAV